MHRKFKLGVDLCAYCGERVATDREDPIPRALYPKKLRHGVKFLKIPACRECNDLKARVDDDLRDYLAIDHRSQSHPMAARLFANEVIRAAQRNHVRLMDRFYEGHYVGDFTPEGQPALTGYAVPIEEGSVLEAVKWLVRGVHWAVFGHPVAGDDAAVFLIPEDKTTEWALRFHAIPKSGVYQQGGPFTCAWARDEHGRVIWALAFFDAVLFIAFTQDDTKKGDRGDSGSRAT